MYHFTIYTINMNFSYQVLEFEVASTEHREESISDNIISVLIVSRSFNGLISEFTWVIFEDSKFNKINFLTNEYKILLIYKLEPRYTRVTDFVWCLVCGVWCVLCSVCQPGCHQLSYSSVTFL